MTHYQRLYKDCLEGRWGEIRASFARPLDFDNEIVTDNEPDQDEEQGWIDFPCHIVAWK